MNRRVCATLAVLFHCAYAWDAAACGPTPLLLSTLLPEARARDVPVDAALIASSNGTQPTFQLREVASDEAAELDAGDAAVPLETECFDGNGGAVCVARPVKPLEPLTTYEWSALTFALGNPDHTLTEPSSWQTFTTAAAPVDATLPDIAVRVVEHLIVSMSPCVDGRLVKLEFSSEGVTPVVLNIEGLTPEYVTQAVALTATSNPTQMTLYDAPECFTIETYDAKGTRAPLRELCPEAQLPATVPAPTEPAGVPAQSPESTPSDTSTTTSPDQAPPTDDREGVQKKPVEETSRAGCSVSATTTSSGSDHAPLLYPGLILLGGFALYRRRHTRPC
jgi:MYXO-CTERM domain-containing protein